MRVLLDTAALYVATGVSNLTFTSTVRRLLEHPETIRIVNPISFVEIAIKAHKGLPALTQEQVDDIIFDLDLTVLPFLPKHAFRLFGLPLHHRDPFDRMLIATALAEDIAILANDRIFRRYEGLRVIW